jgi:hypothetical protein
MGMADGVIGTVLGGCKATVVGDPWQFRLESPSPLRLTVLLMRDA